MYNRFLSFILRQNLHFSVTLLSPSPPTVHFFSFPLFLYGHLLIFINGNILSFPIISVSFHAFYSHLYLSIYISISIYLPIYPSIYLSIYLYPLLATHLPPPKSFRYILYYSPLSSLINFFPSFFPFTFSFTFLTPSLSPSLSFFLSLSLSLLLFPSLSLFISLSLFYFFSSLLLSPCRPSVSRGHCHGHHRLLDTRCIVLKEFVPI